MPGTSSLSMADAERKRQRACVYVKRSYEKKKATLATLRAEVDALEREYHALVATRATPADAADRSAQLRRNYHELTRLRQELYAENEEVRTRLREHMLLEARLQQVLDMYGSLPLSEMPFRVRYLSVEETRPEIAASRAEVLRLLRQSARTPAGLEVFGWMDRRDIHDGVLTFVFEKRFAHASPADLAARTWALLASPATNRSIYSSSMNAQVYTLQHMDENTALFYWTMRPDDVPLVLKTVLLLARFAIPGGYAIVCRTLDKDVVGFEADGINALIDETRNHGDTNRTDYWVKMNITMAMERVGESDCKYRFAGATMASVWAVEILLICMRFEQLALGARLLPPPL